MLVRFLGFSLKQKGAITLESLFSSLGSTTFEPEKNKEGGRFVFTDTESNEKYFLGLIVTVKSQRTFCELKSLPAGFKVVVNGIDEKSSLMEFNFFVVNKNSGLGIYQHYHQSCSTNNALYILKSHHNSLLREERERHADSLVAEKGISIAAARKSALKVVNSTISSAVLIRKESLKKILEEMKKIKAMEVDFDYLIPIVEEFKPLTATVRRQRERFAFYSTANVSSLVKPIVDAFRAKEVKSGRVFGVDENGVDRIIRISENPDNFGEFDYDDVASKINDLDVQSFQSSWVIKALLEASESHRHIFEATIED